MRAGKIRPPRLSELSARTLTTIVVVGIVSVLAITWLVEIFAPARPRSADAGSPETRGPITVSEGGGSERPLTGTLAGRVVSEDGANLEFEVGSHTYVLHHLPRDRYEAMIANGSARQRIEIGKSGLLSVSMPAPDSR